MMSSQVFNPEVGIQSQAGIMNTVSPGSALFGFISKHCCISCKLKNEFPALNIFLGIENSA